MLLEDLLEQEKREQEKQLHSQNSNVSSQENSNTASSSALLSDHDFERLKADVFNTTSIGLNPSNPQSVPGENYFNKLLL